MDERQARGLSLPQQPLLRDCIVLSPMGDFNTLAYLPHKDVVIPPASTATPHLLEWYGNISRVKPPAQRPVFVFYAGTVDARTGSFVRKTLMEGSLFPQTKSRNKLSKVSGNRYYSTLGYSVFCIHVFGTVGWTFRLGESMFAGCIPVLTSDVTHNPFADVLDWSQFSVFVDWRSLEGLEATLLSIAPAELDRLQMNLLIVRDAFVYRPIEDELQSQPQSKHRLLSPLLLTMISIQLRLSTSFPTAP